MSKREQGFTLIELLVVIAIIGILSSVVLASLNSARGKGQVAVVKSNLANMRAEAALYYDSAGNSSYSSFCTADSVLQSASTSAAAGADYVGCNATANTFVVLAHYKTGIASAADGVAFCVDSNGYAGTSGSSTVTAGTLCK